MTDANANAIADNYKRFEAHLGQGYYESFVLDFYETKEAACAAAVKLDVKRESFPQCRSCVQPWLMFCVSICSALRWHQGWGCQCQTRRPQERRFNDGPRLASLLPSATRST